MSLVTTLLTQYQKFGFEDLVGLSARTRMSRDVAETFYRRSCEPGYAAVVQALLDPLDEDSRAVVQKVIARQHYIFTNNLLQHRHLYDDVEIANRRALRKTLPPLAAELNIPPALIAASVLYYHHGLRHTDLPAADFIKRFEGRDVIDVGAAIGDSAYIFDKHYKPRRIHSFEPDSHRIPLLRQFVTRHQLDRVSLVESALGPEAGKLPDGSPMQMLDTYVKDNALSVGLIKMDVEGAEEMVLSGAKQTLREQKPLLIVSMYHNGQQFFDLLPLIRSIQPEYRFAVRKIDDRSPVYETTLFCY